jgi:hypothetical protein
MAKRRPKARRVTPEPLPEDRCPNCDGPLKILADQPETLCPTCGIYLEILRPLPPGQPAPPETGREAVQRRHDLAKFYLTYEDLGDLDEDAEAESPTSEPSPASPPGAHESEAPHPPAELARLDEPAPEVPTSSEAATEEPTLPVEFAAPEVAPPEEPPSVGEPFPSGDNAPPEVEVSSAEAIVSESPVVDDESGQILLLPPAYEEGAFEEIPAEAPMLEEAVAEDEVAAIPAKPRRAHRIVFYVGAAQVALGGAGLVLGSLFHDVFRMPYVGRAYEVFGPLNMTAALLGALFVGAGIAAMAFGARRGSPRRARAAGG